MYTRVSLILSTTPSSRKKNRLSSSNRSGITRTLTDSSPMPLSPSSSSYRSTASKNKIGSGFDKRSLCPYSRLNIRYGHLQHSLLRLAHPVQPVPSVETNRPAGWQDWELAGGDMPGTKLVEVEAEVVGSDFLNANSDVAVQRMTRTGILSWHDIDVGRKETENNIIAYPRRNRKDEETPDSRDQIGHVLYCRREDT
ncbi:hypothetical protein KC338_g189 [Hortaea werneckii]|nr:hypothetical protein KC338_g189 [Hortaea werneckii]